MIRVLIVEYSRTDSRLTAALLKKKRTVSVAGHCRIAEDVIPTVMDTKPDVVLLNLIMPRRRGENEMDICGLEVAEELLSDVPGTPVLIYTGLMRPDLIRKAQEIGASGYLRKGRSATELLDGVRCAAQGQSLWDVVEAN